jgi:hypothetical protein
MVTSDWTEDGVRHTKASADKSNGISHGGEG